MLRTSLMPQLLETAAYNRNRKNDDAAMFEIGSVFHTDEETLTRLPQEKHRLAILLTGSRNRAEWNRKAEAYDFYDAEGHSGNAGARARRKRIDRLRSRAAGAYASGPHRGSRIRRRARAGHDRVSGPAASGRSDRARPWRYVRAGARAGADLRSMPTSRSSTNRCRAIRPWNAISPSC